MKIITTKPKMLSRATIEKLEKNNFLVIESPEVFGINIKDAEVATNLYYVFTTCCSCGDRIYVTNERMSALKTGKKTFYCPQGHSQSFE